MSTSTSVNANQKKKKKNLHYSRLPKPVTMLTLVKLFTAWWLAIWYRTAICTALWSTMVPGGGGVKRWNARGQINDLDWNVTLVRGRCLSPRKWLSRIMLTEMNKHFSSLVLRGLCKCARCIFPAKLTLSTRYSRSIWTRPTLIVSFVNMHAIQLCPWRCWLYLSYLFGIRVRVEATGPVLRWQISPGSFWRRC